MKKETISVLKPHNGKQSKSKVSKNTNKNAGNIQKKVGSPRGAAKIKIVNIEQVNIGDQLKNVKVVKSELANTKTTSNAVSKVQNGKKKNSPSNGKMAATQKDGAVETRAQPKSRPKINLVEKRVKVQKENKSEAKTVTVESEKIKRQAEDVKTKKEKKIKLETKTVPAPKERKIKLEPKPVQEPKKEKKNKAEKTVAQRSKKEKKIKVETKANGEKKKSKNKAHNPNKTVRGGNLELTTEHISNAVQSIIVLHQKKMETKKSLLPMESLPIYLQVTSVKIAQTPRRFIRPSLPHSYVGPLDDVALFVPDLVRGRKQDYEKTVDHWETILRQKGIDFIKEIIPMNRVKTEYSQFEMRRKLAASFDRFLVDGKIAGHMNHLLGKSFLCRKGPPTPVKLDNDDLKKELETALGKTTMEIHKFGNTHVMQVGTIAMGKEQLTENISAACKTLAAEYPGGWENIRMIQVKTTLSLAIPIYVNLASKNSVKTPVVKPKRPRAYETVEGELTTIPGKTTVRMTPEGRVKVTRERDEEDHVPEVVAKESDEENDGEEAESEDEDEQ